MRKSITRVAIANSVAKKAGISKASAKRILNLYHEEVSNNLIEGVPVYIKDFGKYDIYHRPKREGINPNTQKRMTIPPRIQVKFKPSSNLAKAVAGEK